MFLARVCFPTSTFLSGWNVAWGFSPPSVRCGEGLSPSSGQHLRCWITRPFSPPLLPPHPARKVKDWVIGHKPSPSSVVHLYLTATLPWIPIDLCVKSPVLSAAEIAPVLKCLLCKPEDQNSSPRSPPQGGGEKARLVTCVCTPSPGEAETGGSLRLIDQPV